uniref:CENP-V/GFA domain-containing protein n=1 Tax=Aureoumbra lagunensis TaxID=44058 RepID=A0A7S3K468_9STRA|mmetsp:Transcript_20763/g.26865  ORF Transcript_20763/g.26865 Transcript_20763/m.26865 type:complete len:141 (+) Transcript_20763:93-515(+)
MSNKRTGGCLCGKVRYAVNGNVRGVVWCHCSQCQRSHGATAAYTSAPKSSLIIDESNVSWYESSETSRRGFCSNCGSSLFYDSHSSLNIEISAGTFDQPTHLKCIGHIFSDSISDYYKITDELPRYRENDLDGQFAVLNF